eukprot:GHVT01069687.1.p2 GENE.GHVT01069687.1~~GHVT01069687.1.p2  ORF type:complete len:113 (-),score=2.89 GHVT01069687.1:328-666(-)
MHSWSTRNVPSRAPSLVPSGAFKDEPVTILSPVSYPTWPLRTGGTCSFSYSNYLLVLVSSKAARIVSMLLRGTSRKTKQQHAAPTPTVALDPILIFADADDTTVERRPTIQA